MYFCPVKKKIIQQYCHIMDEHMREHIKFMDHILRGSKKNIKRVNVEQRKTENIVICTMRTR